MEKDFNVDELELVEIDENENTLDVKRERMDWGEMKELSMKLAESTIIPVSYQNRWENVFIAMDMASRMGVSPMFVMQNMYTIHGKPSWSGQAVASMIRNSPLFTDVELVYVGEEGDDSWGAYVKAKSTKSGKILKGATVTIDMAKAEGWYQKTGSKWQTIPELMLAYRSYAFFGRVYAPELMMGLHSSEEMEDVRGKESSKVEDPYD